MYVFILKTRVLITTNHVSLVQLETAWMCFPKVNMNTYFKISYCTSTVLLYSAILFYCSVLKDKPVPLYVCCLTCKL